jgi:hypothetical protein
MSISMEHGADSIIPEGDSPRSKHLPITKSFDDKPKKIDQSRKQIVLNKDRDKTKQTK